jgi:hypothetical protein
VEKRHTGAEERQRRIGRNEALFREVNERIERVSASLDATDTIGILCECGDESCTDKIDVSLATYERVRQEPTLFFVRPGHAKPDVERVVEQPEAYEVVRKTAGPAVEYARELDPRNG